MANHSEEEDGEVFACEHCGRVCETKESLTHHVEKRHAKKSHRERKRISEHARLLRVVNPAYMVQKRKAWTEHESYRDERDLVIRCGEVTFRVHGVFMSQVGRVMFLFS